MNILNDIRKMEAYQRLDALSDDYLVRLLNKCFKAFGRQEAVFNKSLYYSAVHTSLPLDMQIDGVEMFEEFPDTIVHLGETAEPWNHELVVLRIIELILIELILE